MARLVYKAFVRSQGQIRNRLNSLSQVLPLLLYTYCWQIFLQESFFLLAGYRLVPCEANKHSTFQKDEKTLFLRSSHLLPQPKKVKATFSYTPTLFQEGF